MTGDRLPIALSPVLATTVNEMRMEEDDISSLHFRINFGIYFFVRDFHCSPVTFIDTFFPLWIAVLNKI